jgi:hypothetical protein
MWHAAIAPDRRGWRRWYSDINLEDGAVSETDRNNIGGRVGVLQRSGYARCSIALVTHIQRTIAESDGWLTRGEISVNGKDLHLQVGGGTIDAVRTGGRNNIHEILERGVHCCC